MSNYLRHACVAAIFGQTLFVHGAVDARTAGYVPDDATRFCSPAAPQGGRMVEFVSDWVDELNGLLERGLADHAARPEWDAERKTRGGEVLLALQNRDAMWGRSIISNSYADGGCITTEHAARAREAAIADAEARADPSAFAAVASDPLDKGVAAWLLRGGIRRVVVGHKPSGDCAAVLSATHTGVEIVSADTCYADPRAADRRGASVSHVLLRGSCLEEMQTQLFGTLATGARHRALLPVLRRPSPAPWRSLLQCLGRREEEQPDLLVGRRLPDGRWVKARVLPAEGQAEARYLCCSGSGRRVEHSYLGAGECRRLMGNV